MALRSSTSGIRILHSEPGRSLRKGRVGSHPLRPVHFRLSPGNIHDCTEAIPLLEGAPGQGEHTVADKGYDSDELREHIVEQGSKPVIPYKANRTNPGRLNRKIYRLRHKIENVFCSLKRFRSIATRYDKLARNFAGMVALGCVFLWLKD
jgi:transposase